MSFDDEQKRKALQAKEQRAKYKGKTEMQTLKNEIAAVKQKEKLSTLQRQILKDEIMEHEQKSAPSKAKKKEIVSSNDRAGDTKTFVETQQERQKTIDQALAQEPEQEGESPG